MTNYGLKHGVDLYSHRPPETLQYRERFNLFTAGHSQRIRDKTQFDFILPSKRSLNVLKKCPAPVDLVCATLISNLGKAIALLLPPGTGKSTAACELSGVSVSPSSGTTVIVQGKDGASFQIFSSDMAWISVIDGRLCFFQPQGETEVFAWDLARLIARDSIGKKRFEAERKLSPEQRTQSKIYGRLFIMEPFPAILRAEICFPEVVLVAESGSRPTRRSTEPATLLKQAILTQAVHSSPFWSATKELNIRIQRIVNTIEIWPRLSTLSNLVHSDLYREVGKREHNGHLVQRIIQESGGES